MTETISGEEAAATARVMAAALNIGRRLEPWSVLLLAIALVLPAILALPLLAKVGIVISFLAAGLQLYFSLRVAFDARIFSEWSKRWDRMAPVDSEAPLLERELASFDRALMLCGLRENTGFSGAHVRAFENRLAGASRQLKFQIAALFVQFIATASVAIILQFSIL